MAFLCILHDKWLCGVCCVCLRAIKRCFFLEIFSLQEKSRQKNIRKGEMLLWFVKITELPFFLRFFCLFFFFFLGMHCKCWEEWKGMRTIGNVFISFPFYGSVWLGTVKEKSCTLRMWKAIMGAFSFFYYLVFYSSEFLRTQNFS